MKHKILFLLPLLCLASCGSKAKLMDDIDLQYYVHHLNHSTFRRSTKAKVTIKQFNSDERKTYSFSPIIWSDNNVWQNTVECQEYLDDGSPFGSAFWWNCILCDETVTSFLNSDFGVEYYTNDYRFEQEVGPNKEYTPIRRLAEKSGKKLSLYSQYIYSRYTEKTWIDDEEDGHYIYDEGLVSLKVIVRAIYSGENIQSFGCYICSDFYSIDFDQDCYIRSNEYKPYVFKTPIDYCEWRVSFS